MEDVVITSAVRTAIGKFKGCFSDIPAPNLASEAIKEAVRRSEIDPQDVTEVFMGCVLQAGLYQNAARQSLIYAGIPNSVSGTTVNMVCGSGMRAMAIAFLTIQRDPSQILVAGGMENMTRTPYYLPKARMGYNLDHGKVLDGMIIDGLWDIYNDFHMAVATEHWAARLGITREMCDEWSYRSHVSAARAMDAGLVGKEIVPVMIKAKGGSVSIDKDEGVRPNTTIEGLSKLPTVFKKDGVLTAGNSSQISDGASASIMMSAKKAEELGIEPLAKIVDFCSQAVAPEEVMGAPIPCVKKLFAKTKLTMNDMEYVEHNEAFSAATVGVKRDLGIPDEILNVRGGAIALGHPIGCSGNRIVVTLLHIMKEKDAHRGLATLCIGGGDAMAMILER